MLVPPNGFIGLLFPNKYNLRGTYPVSNTASTNTIAATPMARI
jgi:hypothetical protein